LTFLKSYSQKNSNQRDPKDGNQRRLLIILKDAIYSAVDVLDSFEYGPSLRSTGNLW
jgi:hypothetical protein